MSCFISLFLFATATAPPAGAPDVFDGKFLFILMWMRSRQPVMNAFDWCLD